LYTFKFKKIFGPKRHEANVEPAADQMTDAYKHLKFYIVAVWKI